MIPVKVVFQGGGAKLVTLMAAASVLQDLQTAKEIQITKIAGTSAGAIVACMLASDLTLEQYRERVERAGRELIDHFSTSWPKIALAIKLWAGGTVLNEKMLRLFLQKVFNGEGKEYKEYTFDKLLIPTTVIVSDISKLKQAAYSSTEESAKLRNVVDVLCDSCALPFVFRSFKNTNFIVDGGVCSNLAAEELLRDSDGAHVLGFTFEDETVSTPNNVKKYALALMSSAISNGVRNNAERITLSGGEVCELPKEYDTLQFEKALNEGLKERAFTAIKERVGPKLKETLKRFYRRQAIRQSADRVPGQALKAHKKLRDAFPYNVTRSSTVITATSLLAIAHPNHNVNDVVRQIVEFVPQRQMIIALRVGIAKEKGIPLADENACWIEDKSGRQISATWFLVPDTGPEGHYFVLIYLDSPFPQSSGTIRVILHTQQQGLLDSLKNHGKAFFRSKAGKLTPTTIEDFVIISHLGLSLTDLKSNVELLPEEARPTNLSDMSARWVTGRQMNQEELQECTKGLLLPAQCISYGWRTEAIKADHFCGVFLQKLP